MREWFRSHPFVLLLLPLVAFLLLCDLTGWPIDLLRHTDVPYIGTESTFFAIAEDYPTERAKTWRYTCSLYPTSGESRTRAYVYIRKDSTRLLPAMGDTLWLCTTLRRPDSIGEFDYATYLRRQGIAGTCYVQGSQWQHLGKATHPHGFIRWARWTQHRLFEQYQQWGISEPQLGTLAALSLGYKEDLDDDIHHAFQRSGATHILAVSGMHTGIIYSIILTLLTCFHYRNPRYEERLRRVMVVVVVIVSLWLYAFLTGLSPSVVRAVIMLTINELAYALYRRPNSVNTIAAAAFLILCFQPLDLFSVSFQLSFAAVTAIIVLEPHLRQLIPQPEMPKRLRSIYLFLSALITVSLAAQIGTLPFTLYYYGQTTYYFMLTNLVVIPVAIAMMWGAFATFIVGVFSSSGAVVLAKVVEGITWVMHNYVQWVEQLPGCTVETSISSAMVVCYFGAVVCAYMAFKRSFWWFVPTALSLTIFCLLY